MKTRLIFCVGLTAAVLMCATAGATGTKHHPKPPAPEPVERPVATATSTSTSGAKSTSDASASVDHVSATTGPVTVTTGPAMSESGSSADNALTQNIKYERSAPSLGQGSLMNTDCGAAGNAGGSNKNGAAFLGFAWTPEDCKLLMVAAAYNALGMNDSACEMLNGTSVAKKRWKELQREAPSCAIRKPFVTAVPPPSVAPAVPGAPALVTQERKDQHRAELVKKTSK